MMEDGSPPPIVVSIERVCSDVSGSMPGVLTDKKGEYIWRMNIDPLETRNCVIRASHAGYSSTEVEVSGVDTTHTTLDLPPIVIRNSVVDPYTLNFSDKGISGHALGGLEGRDQGAGQSKPRRGCTTPGGGNGSFREGIASLACLGRD